MGFVQEEKTQGDLTPRLHLQTSTSTFPFLNFFAFAHEIDPSFNTHYSDLFLGLFLDLVSFIRSRENLCFACKSSKNFSKYKKFSIFFSKFFFALSFLPYSNNTYVLIFYFCDKYSGNAGEILKKQALKKP